MMRIGAFAVAALALVAAGNASAQTSVGVAVGASRQEAGASDIPYLGPPFGGTSTAFVALVDRPLGANATIGGEASFATAITGEQSQRAASSTNAFTSRHSDSIFSGTFKVGTPRRRRVHAAFVVGGGIAYRRTAREGTTAPLLPPSTRAPYSAVIANYVLAASVGGDIDVRMTDRVGVVALARWHRLRDDDLEPGGVVKRGVSSAVFRAGAGVRWRF
jgi:hypothetical protein